MVWAVPDLDLRDYSAEYSVVPESVIPQGDYVEFVFTIIFSTGLKKQLMIKVPSELSDDLDTLFSIALDRIRQTPRIAYRRSNGDIHGTGGWG